MRTLFLCALCFALCYAHVLSRNPCNEPEDTGGATCSVDSDCNEQTFSEEFGVNFCNITTGNDTSVGFCVCALNYAEPDCSHKRYNKNVGQLQFISILMIGGLANFEIRRFDRAVGQLLLQFFPVAISVGFLLVAALTGDRNTGKLNLGCSTPCRQFFCVLLLLYLAGMIWSIVEGALILQGNVPDGDGFLPYNADCLEDVEPHFLL